MQLEENLTLYEKIEDKAVTIANDFPSNLDNLVNNIITREGYKTYEVDRKLISTNGGNYLGVLYEIDVKGTTSSGAKETNIFVKNIIPDADNMKTLSVSRAYKLETFAYKELCKVFDELQNEADIPMQERFKMVKSFDECNPEAIILDNITRKGYKTGFRMDVITLRYAEIAIQQLARFHALSFVIKEKRPTYYNEKIQTVETPYIFCEEWKQFMDAMGSLNLNCLDDEMREKMENIFPRLLDRYAGYLQDVSKLDCLCHGDYRPNNIMMKEVKGEVVDVLPIDYQLLHFGCPVQDLMYFIAAGTDKEFRAKNFANLKNMYYDTVTKYLELFDINAEAVFPRAELEKIIKERMEYILIITIIYGPFIFADEDDIPDVTQDSMINMLFKVDDKYKDRIRGAVEEFIEWGLINDY